MNIWHDMNSTRVKAGHFPVYITISRGSNKRYKFDMETGLLKLEQMLCSSTRYPVNIGIIPKTLGKEGEPMEVLILCQESLELHTLVECSPIGIVRTREKQHIKERIIVLPIVESNQSSIGFVKEHGTLNKFYEEIKYFFEIFNGPEEGGTWSSGVLDGMNAFETVEKGIDRYKQGVFRCEKGMRWMSEN